MLAFLTEKELRELSGAKRRAKAQQWLDTQRIPYLIGTDGWPRVSRAVICARLGENAPMPREPKLHLA